ncbi:MAG: Eco57I restriction-modification methylase domain-containing protein [Caldilineaceae bacterium]|nr:Eco57I restriction-modification methylase domain-containing protein [Caldilineaceae bacterium]
MSDEVRQTIQRLLGALSTRKLDALKQLFWAELNYDRAAASLSISNWPPQMRALVSEARQLFATAGEDAGFQVIYCQLSGANQGQTQPLSLGDERVLVGRLLREHPYALFVFSDRDQVHWHFVNVKYEQDAETRARRVFRRISVSPYETAGPEQRLRTATERLSLLDVASLSPRLTGLTPFVIQNRHDEAFDVEAVTRDFFATYRTVFEEVEREITGLVAEEKRLFTQRLFNRLLFVVFLERKGWLILDERGDYLHALWEAHQVAVEAGDDDNFYRDRLRLLFFSGLNTPNEVDVVGVNPDGFLQHRIGRVPYLNGGLFEEDATDRNAAVVVPDRAIDLILKRLLYHYNFTITESTPLDVEVAVDPEMLGKIFEELVTGRHEQGSYYTPKPVVAFMGQEALKGYLETSCSGEEPDAIAAFVETRDPAGLREPDDILGALRKATICDPACGSGAYLLGMLHELMALRGALAGKTTTDHQTLYDQKLEIIQRNLYGVDIDPFAVNIARLRLWLSLIVEYVGDTPPPLPNLDFKIEAGDSLTAPSPAGLKPDMFRDQQVREYFELKSRYLQAHGSQKVEMRRQIDELRGQMRAWAHASGQIDGFDWVVEFAEVFDGPDWTGATQSGAASEIVNATAGQMELAGSAAERGGFDIVLANPPYVRQELLGSAYKQGLKAIYPEVYAGTADLYVFFYARALQLSKPSGMVVFISSNKFMRAGYGEKLRKHLGATTTLRVIIDYGDLPLFTATTYPCIVATRNQPPVQQAAAQVAVIDDINDVEKTGDVMQQRAWAIAQRSLRPDGWALERPDVLALLAKLRRSGPELSNHAGISFYRGVTTGLNEAFVIDDETRKNLIAADPNSAEIIKPWIRGRNVKRWRMDREQKFLLFTRRGIDIEKYPAVKRHLETFREKLTPGTPNGRKSGNYQWYEIQDSTAYYTELEGPKIIWPDIARQSEFTMDTEGIYPDATLFVIPGENRFLLGILNSQVTDWFIHHTSSSIQQGYLRFKRVYVEKLPVPLLTTEETMKIEALVERLVVLQGAGPEVPLLETRLNALIFHMYNLSPAEIRQIEDSLRDMRCILKDRTIQICSKI